MNKKTPKKKIIVTGGAGFIGSNLAEALVNGGYEVEAIDDLSGGKREQVPEGAVFHNASVCDFAKMKELLRGAQYVFHLAALPRVQFSIEHPIETHEVNVGGTLNVLKAAHEAGVKRVVYAASSSAYGDQTTMPLREDMKADPKSPYGLQKYIGELYSKVWSTVYGLPTVSLRYFNVYGPNQDTEGPYALVIGKFLKQKKEGKPLTITGDGEQTRDFTHVSDIVRANLLAMKSDRVGKGEVINIGAGNNVTVNRLAELVGGAKEHVAERLEPKHTLADIAKAEFLLGWKPAVRLEDGIREMTEELKN